MGTKVKVITAATEEGEVLDVYFDITLVVSKSNEIVVVDNNQSDWRDIVDCNTLTIKKVIIRP